VGQTVAGRTGYVRGLDGLRAIAVAAVVIFHSTANWMRGGFLGVDVFFVLSGFLITSQLLAEWRRRQKIDFRAFWKRRARRLLAALYLLLVGVLAFALIFHPEEVAVFRGDAVAAFFYVANWYFIFHNQPYFEIVAHPSPLLHLWSLSVEEQFYIIWPLLLTGSLLVLRRWAFLVALVLAVASAVLMAVLYQPGVDPSRVYYGTDTHASGLLLGALLAFFWRPGPAWRPSDTQVTGLIGRVRSWLVPGALIDLLALGTLVFLTYAMVVANESQPFLYRGGFFLVAVVTAVCIFAVSHPRAVLLTAVLELAPVRWLGRRSYSVYLWHWPVVVFTRPGFVAVTGYSLLFLRIGLALVLAELSFQLVEEPIRRGGLPKIWERLQAALQMQQWGRVAASAVLGVVLAGFVLGVCIAAAQAPVPPPPAYLAETSVDTIVRPGQAMPAPTPAGSAATGAAATPVATGIARTGESVHLEPPPTPTPTPTPASASDTGVPVAVSGSQSGDSPVEAGVVLAVGDSVMLGAVPALESAIDGIQVDAAVSRQVSTGISLLQGLKSQGVAGNVVVVGLGSNGTFTSGQFDQIMGVLTGVPRVIFINNKVPRSWEESNDSVIAGGVQRYPSARLVDWYHASVDHPEYFYDDQYHVRPDGAAVYASLVAAAVAGP
jgi:peptidoglycan/LPS O-acetylase OafA/YrhL